MFKMTEFNNDPAAKGILDTESSTDCTASELFSESRAVIDGMVALRIRLQEKYKVEKLSE